jgi:hypothetical protein
MRNATVVEPHIVNSGEAIALSPMTIEEAVKDAEFRDRDLLIFRTAGDTFVLHRRRDGQMELGRDSLEAGSRFKTGSRRCPANSLGARAHFVRCADRGLDRMPRRRLFLLGNQSAASCVEGLRNSCADFGCTR